MQVTTLAAMLAGWENTWFLMGLLNALAVRHRGQRACAVTPNAEEFRDFLLNIQGMTDDERVQRLAAFYPGDLQVGRRSTMLKEWLELVPRFFTGWSARSRRVFRLSRDLQGLLNATSLEGIRWADARWPFDAFAVELAEPIIVGAGHPFDFVTVNTFGRSGVEVFAHRASWKRYQPLSRDACGNLRRLARSPHVERAAVEIGRAFDLLFDCIPKVGFVISEEALILPAQETAQHIEARREPRPGGLTIDEELFERMVTDTTDAFTRIVVGLALYLRTLPSGSPHVRDLRPQSPPSGNRAAICSPECVCDVESTIPLTQDEQVFYGVAGTAEERARVRERVRCHFRRGHWRRPPGRGSDPDAEKTVHVRPTIVSLEALPPGNLPTGREQVME